MKKYINFILKNNYIQSISQEKSMEILKSLPYYNNLIDGKTTLIYRKVKYNFDNLYNTYNIVDPKNIERISPYASSNLYNLIFSNIESWSNYPKRNKSLICGDFNDVKYRDGDKLMLVFPLEPKLAVCPVDDIWDSFRMSIYGDLNHFFNELDKHQHKLYMINLDDKNWSALSKQLNNFDKERNYEKYSFLKNIKDSDLANRWFTEKISSLELLNILFDPIKNDFEIINYDGTNIPYDREVWTDSKCLLIDPIKYNNGIIYK